MLPELKDSLHILLKITDTKVFPETRSQAHHKRQDGCSKYSEAESLIYPKQKFKKSNGTAQFGQRPVHLLELHFLCRTLCP